MPATKLVEYEIVKPCEIDNFFRIKPEDMNAIISAPAKQIELTYMLPGKLLR